MENAAASALKSALQVEKLKEDTVYEMIIRSESCHMKLENKRFNLNYRGFYGMFYI